MRILIVNTSERIGGAAIAANRLMKALRKCGVKAKMLVFDKQTTANEVIAFPKSWKHSWNFFWERFVIFFHNHLSRSHVFEVDIANVGVDITTHPAFLAADVIHLHWVNQGFLSLKSLQKIIATGKPIVWTMHDMWPCTGICHHSEACDLFHTHCHNCPLLYKGAAAHDLSYQVFKKKLDIVGKSNISFVTCSHWLEQQAQQSKLLAGKQITAIANPIDVKLYHPMDRWKVREKYRLPQEKKLILFTSLKVTDKRKGIQYLIEACQRIVDLHPSLAKEYGVVVIGEESEWAEQQFPFPVYAIRYCKEEKELVKLYNAVDVFVTPSLQENLPNTIMEAMACGIPCVGFNVGGISEMIDHKENGYVATLQSSNDLAKGIHWVLTNDHYKELSAKAVEKTHLHYNQAHIAKKYMELYTQMMP